MTKIDSTSARQGKELAEHYFKSHGEDFPLELPSDKMFQDMSKIAAAAVFATRLVEVAEEGLILLDELSKDYEEKELKFQEDNS